MSEVTETQPGGRGVQVVGFGNQDDLSTRIKVFIQGIYLIIQDFVSNQDFSPSLGIVFKQHTEQVRVQHYRSVDSFYFPGVSWRALMIRFISYSKLNDKLVS